LKTRHLEKSQKHRTPSLNPLSPLERNFNRESTTPKVSRKQKKQAAKTKSTQKKEATKDERQQERAADREARRKREAQQAEFEATTHECITSSGAMSKKHKVAT
jgi:hypothetical protein